MKTAEIQLIVKLETVYFRIKGAHWEEKTGLETIIWFQ